MSDTGRLLHWMNRIGTFVLVAMFIVEIALIVSLARTNHTVARNNREGYITSCKHTNAVGHGLLDSALARSLHSYKLTFDDPESSATDKAKAQASLDSLRAYQKTQRNVLSDANCVWPPVPIPVPKEIP